MSKRSKKVKVWTSTSALPKWRQSPVDLNRMYLLNEKLPCLLLQGHLSDKSSAKMTNTGSTVKIEFCGDRKPRMWGGPLTDKYEFAEMQFRWGPNDARGAEHSIEDTWFSMEAQAIHYNKKYGSFEACQEKPDGLAIIAFLFQVIGCPDIIDNPCFSCISDNLARIRIPGKSFELPEGCMRWMKEACAEPGYYTYSGSLTTYPFAECVTWIVVPRPVSISSKQANAFRRLYDRRAEPILRNYSGLMDSHVNQTPTFYVKGMSRRKQSPIDIRDDDARVVHFQPLTFIGHWRNSGKATLGNDGRRAFIKLSGDRIPSIIKCGPLGNDEFELYDAHFHWGEDDCCGSEHSLNGTWFSMEAHAVHWNRKYGSFDECLKYEDGLCVLTYLFQVKEPCNSECYAMPDEISSNLHRVIEFGAKTKIPPNCLYWMRSALHSKYYYLYHGSYNGAFNNPECATWIVFPNVMVVRSDQLAELRKLKTAKDRPILSYRRPTQHLYERKIYKVFC